jgi:ATP-dependent Clp protease ATP-binding subunit ClpE
MEAKVRDALKQAFRPEFLNRIDDIIVFSELSKSELSQIVDLMLGEVVQEGREKKISIDVDSKMKEFILNKGYDTKYGARPLRRAIQKYVEDEISESYLKGIIKENSRVSVTINADEKTELYVS